MLKKKFKLFLITLFLLSFTSLSCAQEIFLSLKKSKVNVRYGPSFESPIKFIYKKVNLPLKQIDKKENWRRVIDFKNKYFFINFKRSSLLGFCILHKLNCLNLDSISGK